MVTEKSVLDVHVHLAGSGILSEPHRDELVERVGEARLRKLCTRALDGETGCFASRDWWKVFPVLAGCTGAGTPAADDFFIAEMLKKEVAESCLVRQAVFLALDQVYDADGYARPDATALHVPNDWVAAVVAAGGGKLLFGASVHPGRPKASDELRRIAAHGAVLIKWVPSAQDIKPDAPRHRSFYETMAELELPLLSHVGEESALPCAYSGRPPLQDKGNPLQENNDPGRLRLALDCGVDVIAAPSASFCPAGEPGYMGVLQQMMTRAYPGKTSGGRLYCDLSAFVATPHARLGHLKRIVGQFPQDRLVFGSDYPASMSRLDFARTQGVNWEDGWAEVTGTRNALDRCAKTVVIHGFSDSVLTNGYDVIRPVNTIPFGQWSKRWMPNV